MNKATKHRNRKSNKNIEIERRKEIKTKEQWRLRTVQSTRTHWATHLVCTL